MAKAPKMSKKSAGRGGKSGDAGSKKDEALLKPKKRSARVERILKKREPQLVEGPKNALIMKGHKTSQTITDVLRDLGKLTKPHNKLLSRKNEILPFEDANSIEFLAPKNDCSLFALGSHSKKRPNNLTLGRTFDGHVMDMIEFGVDDYTALTELRGPKKAVGSKPLFVFNGSQWESDTLYTRIQNLLLDFFRGAKLEMMSLQGIDHVIVCTVIDGKIYLRVHSISFRKSGSRVPDVVLVPMGPFLNMTVRRTQLASEDMWKASMRQPKNAAPPKVKNVSNTTLGEKMGRIHMKKQNLDKMGGRRMTALRSSGKGAKQAEAVAEAAAGKPSGKKASKRANDEYNGEFQEEKPKKQKLVDVMI